MKSVTLHGYGWGRGMDLSERCGCFSGCLGCIFETLVSGLVGVVVKSRLFGIMKRGNQKHVGNDIFGEQTY